MTQKRGLGRGLGALIPGAGSPAARPSAPSPAPEHRSPAEADAAGLRTRSHPRTAPEPGEAGASSRPVDMFFSGDPVGAAERTGGRAGSGRDVAGAMARAAAERRASGKTPAKKAAAEKAVVEKAPAKKAPAKTAAGKADAGKTAATKRSPRSTSTTPAGATPEPATAAPETAAPEDVSPEESALESAVEVERVTPTPARSRRPAQADASDFSDHDTAPAGDGAAAPDADVDDAGAVGDGAAMDKAGTASAQDADAVTEPTEPAAEAAAADDLETPAPEDDAPEDDNPEHGAPEDSDGPATENSGREDLLPVPGAEFAEIPIHEIRENPRNPRTQFDEDALDELAYSLREVGVLQPIVVRPIPATDTGESFELVMGERRWRAARRAGLVTIPAIIRETTDDDLLRDALLENLHRSQLNPLEEAAAYQQLLEDFGCTQDELSERIGRSRPQISNTLRLMKLPPLVQRRLASGALSAGHARALLGLDSPALMEELAQRIVAEGLSVRAVERLVSRGVEPAAATKTPRRTSYDPRVVDYTSRLSTRLEAPVRIDVGKRKGKITLEFTNLEDLERLMDRLGIEEYRSDAAEGSEATSHQE
ncbi:ParB/RepB/Spo0J family partition protein [Brachybacterium nesterenkovii]|uniref:Chromosome (Plasmid) partitioning protein ParB n=1 Tax=Brachybacterium nesterenkovii TaxID=47847 RepID=A0A1X6X437_9MICO|nr:ParB/RepB/Spo0J family partition protein [Brachybacterium nesterenkovii]SLM93546.1 Chromosome (plasmid) partitioning protein ParB [Brachybacterium nesterenkovii]